MKNGRILIYVNRGQLNLLLKDELFVASAPLGGATTGGTYVRSNVFFQLKRGTK